MRGINAREVAILLVGIPPLQETVLRDLEDHAAMDSLHARGLLRVDADDVYWTTPMGRIVLMASLSGSAGER